MRPRPAPRSLTPGIGVNSVASRLPRVIVPVLSSSSVSTSPEASTARPESASTLRRTRRSMPGDPDRRQQRPDRGRDQRHQQRDQGRDGGVGARELGERPQRHHRDQEDDREAREQDVERDLVRRLAPLGALDQGDHAVEEALARLLGDLDHDPVREHAGAAGDGAAVAARLADHGGGLAGDRGLVHRGDSLDHGPVARDLLARLDYDHVARLQLRRPGARRRPSASRRSRCGWRAARRPAPCPVPRRAPRRGWRTRRSATATARP